MEALQQIFSRPERIKKIRPPVPSTAPEKEEISHDGLAVTEAEYWKKYYHDSDFSYEWNNGYLEVKPVSDYSGFRVYWWFAEILTHFLKVRPVARVIGLDIGFRLAFPGSISIRKPDLAVILNDNPVIINSGDFSYRGTYDLCIEFLSYSSSKEVRRDTVQKKQEYEGAGVREYFILDPRGLETVFYRLGRKGKYAKIRPSADGVISSAVLGGFQFRISDLYRQPCLTDLTGDPIYRNYVMTEYQAEKQRAEQESLKAEQERQRAEQERQRAEQESLRAEQESLRAEQESQRAEKERQRAEKLAEKLRSLGISPDMPDVSS